jgi:DNA-binding LacI/PurR family transcriptional regulator
VDRPTAGLSVNTVLTDNRPAARQAVIRLLEQGHRRIGYLGDDQNISPIAERYQGYLSAFVDGRAPPDPLLVRHGLRSRPAVAAAAAELAALPVQPQPTALFTANDLITMGVIDSGMHTELALVGFDESALADKLTPPISIVSQDPDVIGTSAATRLFARINGDVTPPRELILRTRFISRGSEETSPH